MSQGILSNVTSGTLPGLTAIDIINNAFDALVTMNSGSTAPANASESMPAGQLWLNTSVNPYLVQISDGAAWLTIGYLDVVNHTYTTKGPTGTGGEHWGAPGTIPVGTLLCYGQTVPIASYPALAAVLGTTYGGDGVTTFGLPDKRGRASAGKDDMGGTAAGRLTYGGSGITGTTLGASGGAETYTLTVGNLAVHNHTAGVATHNHTLHDPQHNHTGGDTGHSHGAANGDCYHLQTVQPSGGYTTAVIGSSTGGYNMGVAGGNANVYINNNTTGIYIDNASPAVTVNNNGSGTPHQNTQPTIICNYYIWY